MEEEKYKMFRNRLTKVFRHLNKQARRLNVSCYRVYDHDLPEFPFCIEFYEDRLYVAEYKRRHGMSEEDHDKWMEKSIGIMMDVLSVKKENIFLKLRLRKPGRLGQYQKIGDVQHEFIVTESGLKFIVNLSDYLDTGLFLDHRITRQMIREQSDAKKILNLFSYTGSFSVYAAAGSAEEVISVDLSKTYLGWAKKNMKLNEFIDKTKYKFIHADVKQYLKTITPDYFDLIIMDPPTFSNSKRMEGFLDIQKDHVALINDCLKGIKGKGILYFSTNSRKFFPDKIKIDASQIKDITKATTSFDFEGKPLRHCYTIYK